MKFEYDIYISFSKKDNQVLSGNDKGWISNFHRFLEIRISQLLSKKPKFLYYPNGEKPSASEIAKACVMISVISPEYAKSPECMEDIEVFYETFQKREIAETGEKPRIFKAVKFPVPFEQQHSKIRSLLGYDMFETDLSSGTPKELQSFFNTEAERSFWMQLDDLSHDIVDIIKEIAITSEREAVKKSECVYLADTGYDLSIARDLIKRELRRHGYRILPEQELPTDLRELESAIRKDLKECILSIHLIGDSYGDIPVSSEKSVVDLQNELAAEYSIQHEALSGRDKKFNRLIWLSPNAKFINEKQKSFVENLRRSAEKMSGAEVIQVSLEDLKNLIWNQLLDKNKNKDNSSNERSSSGSQVPIVYLIYDRVDSESGKELANTLQRQGNDVLHPLLEGELMNVRSRHFDNLRKCDIAMIYYGKVNEQWVQMKVLDLLKAPGMGRTKPLLSKALYVEKGPKIDKEKMHNYGISIIENNENMNVVLDSFTAKTSNLQ